MEPTLWLGLRAMSRAAATVSLGVVPPTGVAAAKRRPQGAVSDVLPLELTQEERMSPSVLIVAEGMLATAGAVPGDRPVKTDTMLCAVAKAFSRPCTLPGLVPMCA